MVPVNLQKLFSRHSRWRNFFGWIEAGHAFDRRGRPLRRSLQACRGSSSNGSWSRSGWLMRMNDYVRLEKNPSAAGGTTGD